MTFASPFWRRPVGRGGRAGATVGAVPPEPAPYAETYIQSKEYQHAIRNPRGSESFWTDPLVVRLFDGASGGAAKIRLTEAETRVGPVIDAVTFLHGLHGGQWPRVSDSIEALADALYAWQNRADDAGHGARPPWGGDWSEVLDRAHILDAIGYPVAAAYDAATAKERAAAAAAAAQDAEAPPPPEPEPQRTIHFRVPVQRSRASSSPWVAALLVALAVGVKLARG